MCPFVNVANPGCSVCLNLRNITRAFGLCADRYAECPVYQRLVADARELDKAEAAPVLLAAS